MQDGRRNIDDLFGLAKQEKVNYGIKNVTKVINNAATTGAVGGASSIFNLSNIVIMIGSIVSIATVAVLISSPQKITVQESNFVTESTPIVVVEKVISTPIIEKVNPQVEVEPVLAIMEEIVTEPTIYEEELIVVDENLMEVEMETFPEPVIEERIFAESFSNNAEPPLVENCNVICGESKALEAFHSIELNVGLNIEIKKGDSHAAKFEGPSELMQYVDLGVNNGVLTIGIKKEGRKAFQKSGYNASLTVHLTMSEIKSVTVNGSGDVHSDEAIPSDELFIQVNGSGDITFHKVVPNTFKIDINGSGDVSLEGEGKIKNGKVNINGSGDVCVKALNAESINVSITGSGDVKVKSDGDLTVDIIGSGDVCYQGEAKVKVNEMGSGEVRKCR